MFTTINSGQTASAPFTLPRTDRAHVMYVPSMAPNFAWSISFATNSGGTPTYHRGLFHGRDWVVVSAVGPTCARFDAYNAFARVTVSPAATTTASVEILAING